MSAPSELEEIRRIVAETLESWPHDTGARSRFLKQVTSFALIELKFSRKQVAEIVGLTPSATAYHCVQVEKQTAADPDYRRFVERVISKLRERFLGEELAVAAATAVAVQTPIPQILITPAVTPAPMMRVRHIPALSPVFSAPPPAASPSPAAPAPRPDPRQVASGDNCACAATSLPLTSRSHLQVKDCATSRKETVDVTRLEIV